MSQQDFTYEKKIGETVTTVYYSDGSSSTILEPIMTKEKETLPHLVCKERACHLGSKTQRDSAQSKEVRNQLKDNYSFCEMPRTLNQTYRLIAGDRQDSYRRSMADEMCFGSFWTGIILFMGILFAVSMFKDLNVANNVYSYLFGSAEALAFYSAMVVLLMITYIAFQAIVGTKTKLVMNSKEFRDEVAHFEDLEYDIYLTKWLADTKEKERKKSIKNARKEGLTVDKAQDNRARHSDGQWEKRKKAYRSSLIAIVKETLEKNGYSTESYYYNQCYILRAYSHSTSQPDCDFFISKDNCFMRGSTRFNYGAHQNYIEGEINDVLRNGGFNDVDFYVDKDLLCSRVSFGLLASSTLDVEELNTSNAKEMISAYFEAMSTIRKRVSPNVLATVEPEHMVIREVNRNGFTWE